MNIIIVFIVIIIAIIVLRAVIRNLRMRRHERRMIRRQKRRQNRRAKKYVHNIADAQIEMTPNDFFDFRITEKDFTGVYVLLNKTKHKYYIGKTAYVLQNVNSHLTGHGNIGVYYDYKYGDEFIIKLVHLKNSGCESLEELKRKTAMAYDGFYDRYDQT